MYAQINEHKSYLRQTDYKVIKEAETEYVMPNELKDRRQFARDEINRLEYEVELIIEQLEEDEQNQEDVY